MKVILLRDVARLGRKGTVADVPTGYAMNQLIPSKSAAPATPENLKKADSRMMDWMHDFTDTYVKDRTPVAKMTAQELEQGIDGLQGELQEVKDLRDFTHKSLDEATTTLK